jgi:hypothetical protein
MCMRRAVYDYLMQHAADFADFVVPGNNRSIYDHFAAILQTNTWGDQVTMMVSARLLLQLRVNIKVSCNCVVP